MLVQCWARVADDGQHWTSNGSVYRAYWKFPYVCACCCMSIQLVSYGQFEINAVTWLEECSHGHTDHERWLRSIQIHIPNKHEMLIQCCFNAGSVSQIGNQHCLLFPRSQLSSQRLIQQPSKYDTLKQCWYKVSGPTCFNMSCLLGMTTLAHQSQTRANQEMTMDKER